MEFEVLDSLSPGGAPKGTAKGAEGWGEGETMA